MNKADFAILMGIFYKYVLNGIVHTMDQNKFIIQRQNEIEALVRRNKGNGYSNFGQSNNGYWNNGYSNNGF